MSKTKVVKHEKFDPDKRPPVMAAMDGANMENASSAIIFVSGMSRADAVNKLIEVYKWARHLEKVRVGLQRTINQFNRMYQSTYAQKPDQPDGKD